MPLLININPSKLFDGEGGRREAGKGDDGNDGKYEKMSMRLQLTADLTIDPY
jgi:hypothetical protein